jgi:rhodanese-related sulfurtransferase
MNEPVCHLGSAFWDVENRNLAFIRTGIFLRDLYQISVAGAAPPLVCKPAQAAVQLDPFKDRLNSIDNKILFGHGVHRDCPVRRQADDRVQLHFVGWTSMPSTSEITVAQLSRLIGLPDMPVIIDVRMADDIAEDGRCLPTAYRRDYATVAQWAPQLRGRKVVVVCQRGLKLSQGVAAWLRHEGVQAETLEGGFAAWREAGSLLARLDHMPAQDIHGRSVWVTRARPKVDRIACAWLIRRFVDRDAVFLYVAPSEVLPVADRFQAAPFDVDGVFWSHRAEHCTFDTMLDEFDLRSPPLDRFATIIRGADTARLDLAPQAAGFLAASLGLSRMHRDDLEQLAAGLPLYDVFYRWCRDALDETHDWPQTAGNSRPR